MAYEVAHKDAPWLTASMIDIMASWLRPNDSGLEWGSGRSTLWFAKRVAKLVSIEHDATWYASVSRRIDNAGLRERVQHFLLADGIEERGDSAYVAVVANCPDATLDFCLVDGVSRSHCAFAALDKIRPGGVLIVDNCNWYLPRAHPSSSPNSRSIADGFENPVWESFLQRVENWRNIWTTNGVSDTGLWVRPSDKE